MEVVLPYLEWTIRDKGDEKLASPKMPNHKNINLYISIEFSTFLAVSLGNYDFA